MTTPRWAPRRLTLSIAMVAMLTAIGGVARFVGLDRESFWIDETITAQLVGGSLVDLLRAVPDAESTPPFYYVLAWLWSQALGVDEAGLRSLSALFGTLTIPVCYAAARTLVSPRAGVITAALAAVSPLLVWYSQEARAYSLFVLLGALSFLYFAKALVEPSKRHLWLWAVASSLTLVTHYFGVFLVVAEAAVLLYRHRGRATWLATAAIAGVGLAILPLAAYQAIHASSRWIRLVKLPDRVEEALRQLVLPAEPSIWAGAGVSESNGRSWWPLAVVMVLGAAAAVLALGTRSERRGGLIALGVGTATVSLPVLMSIAAEVTAGGRGDVFLFRNVIVAWLPLAVVLAAALGARRAGRVGLVAASTLVAASLAVLLHNVTTPHLQRDDWSLVSQALSRSTGQIVILSPSWQMEALEYHAGGVRELGAGATVEQIDLLVRRQVPSYSPAVQDLEPPLGFELVETRELQNWTLTRFRSPEPVYIRPSDLGVAPPGSSYVPLVRSR